VAIAKVGIAGSVLQDGLVAAIRLLPEIVTSEGNKINANQSETKAIKSTMT
jgi:hypothetical protein